MMLAEEGKRKGSMGLFDSAFRRFRRHPDRFTDSEIVRLQESIRLAANVPVVMWWIGRADSVTSDFHICDGHEISRRKNPELFKFIGTRFGSGDGVSTFNLPDIRGKMIIGKSESLESGDEVLIASTIGPDDLELISFVPVVRAM